MGRPKGTAELRLTANDSLSAMLRRITKDPKKVEGLIEAISFVLEDGTARTLKRIRTNAEELERLSDELDSILNRADRIAVNDTWYNPRIYLALAGHDKFLEGFDKERPAHLELINSTRLLAGFYRRRSAKLKGIATTRVFWNSRKNALLVFCATIHQLTGRWQDILAAQILNKAAETLGKSETFSEEQLKKTRQRAWTSKPTSSTLR